MQKKVDYKNKNISAAPVSFDITEHNSVITALKKSEERFRKIFAANPDAMTINRLSDGMFVSLNEGFTKITGYTEEETKGKTSYELNIWTSSSQRESMVKGLQASGTVQNLEGKFRKKDGSLRDGQMSATIIDLEGVPHILSITRDITERKLAVQELEKRTEELRISEEKFKNVFEFAPVGKSLTMLDGTVNPNKAFCQLLGIHQKRDEDNELACIYLSGGYYKK